VDFWPIQAAFKWYDRFRRFSLEFTLFYAWSLSRCYLMFQFCAKDVVIITDLHEPVLSPRWTSVNYISFQLLHDFAVTSAVIYWYLSCSFCEYFVGFTSSPSRHNGRGSYFSGFIPLILSVSRRYENERWVWDILRMELGVWWVYDPWRTDCV